MVSGELSQNINQTDCVLLFLCILVYKYVDRRRRRRISELLARDQKKQ